MMLRRLHMLVSLLLLNAKSSTQQSCSINIPDAERRECHPWINASQSSCEARGCIWCASSADGFPHCFFNDRVCPSVMPESSRVDCLPEGGSREQCLQKRCTWCETSTPGVPWCFNDPSVSLGGELCASDIPNSERIDCHPENGATRERCLARGCFWCSATPADGTPWCFMPRQQGYRVSGGIADTAKGYRATLERVNTPSWYGVDINTVLMEVEFHTADRLRIKFSDATKSRFEVPLNIESPPAKAQNTLYDIAFTTSPVFSLKVTRKETGAVIFDTSIGGLILSDQFLQIATKLESPILYGFGEHEHHTLRHDMNWRKWAMYSRDQAVSPSNLYGVQPFYVNLERSSRAHGVLFLNSNAQDVTLSPAPAVTYRTLGGVLDIYLFLGPTPDNVIEQYTGAVGRPLMVPYWALGFQLCRYGYRNLEHMKEAVNRMRQYDIPHDIQYADIDYMDGWKDFTLNYTSFAGLPNYVRELRQQGTRFMIILDPAIYRLKTDGSYPTYDRGNQYDVWVKKPDGTPAPGRVWPGPAYFPDYSRPSTQTWWTQECVLFNDVVPVDGLWIDMNEPASFDWGYSDIGCADTPINNPMYMPSGLNNQLLWAYTLCPDAVQDFGINYNVHSLYGWSMAKQSLPAAREVTKKRSIVFSRSTFPGGGSYAQHWLGDNFSNWNNLKYSLIGVMEFNMFGYPYVGPDICGFIGPTNEELCNRWQQIGAFYTFSRNHNAIDNPDQDPGIWPEVARVTRDTLLIRYTLLPYLYTLFHKTHTEGSPVLRPLFFEFPSDANTYSIDEQMLWGHAFMMSPALYQGQTTVQAYFPDARWYSYYDGAEVTVRRSSAILNAPLGFIPLHIQGGYILPTQQPANSTVWSRYLPMGLIVALDDTRGAAGSLFWDDGDSIDTFENNAYYLAEFTASNGQLTSSIVFNGYSETSSLRFDDVRVMGIPSLVNSVTVNGQPFGSWSQNTLTKQLVMSNLNLPIDTAFTIVWT